MSSDTLTSKMGALLTSGFTLSPLPPQCAEPKQDKLRLSCRMSFRNRAECLLWRKRKEGWLQAGELSTAAARAAPYLPLILPAEEMCSVPNGSEVP